jgi:integrase
MSRTLKEAQLTTRTARTKLAKGAHWRAIDPDTHLGYRKSARGGRWLVRWYKGEQAYAQATLATADDEMAADGADVLDFAQARARAKAHVDQQRAIDRASAGGPAATTQDAINDYLKMRETREDAANGAGRKRDARSRLTLHVSSTPLASKALHALNRSDLQAWLVALPDPLRTGTIRRLTNDLKAALNQAGRQHRDHLPADFAATVREGLHIEEGEAAAPRRQVLPDADIRRIIAAAWEVDREDRWEGDLARMVLILAATGARFSQAARLRVVDIQVADGRVMMPVSRKGKRFKKAEHVAFRIGDDAIEALKTIINGRIGAEPLLERWRKRQVSVIEWVRDSRGPWGSCRDVSCCWRRPARQLPTSPDAVKLEGLTRTAHTASAYREFAPS